MIFNQGQDFEFSHQKDNHQEQKIEIIEQIQKYAYTYNIDIPKLILSNIFRKLLKMHESKYEPMEKADAEKIMEEILSMQAGLNPDQQV